MSCVLRVLYLRVHVICSVLCSKAWSASTNLSSVFCVLCVVWSAACILWIICWSSRVEHLFSSVHVVMFRMIYLVSSVCYQAWWATSGPPVFCVSVCGVFFHMHVFLFCVVYAVSCVLRGLVSQSTCVLLSRVHVFCVPHVEYCVLCVARPSWWATSETPVFCVSVCDMLFHVHVIMSCVLRALAGEPVVEHLCSVFLCVMCSVLYVVCPVCCEA